PRACSRGSASASRTPRSRSRPRRTPALLRQGSPSRLRQRPARTATCRERSAALRRESKPGRAVLAASGSRGAALARLRERVDGPGPLGTEDEGELALGLQAAGGGPPGPRGTGPPTRSTHKLDGMDLVTGATGYVGGRLLERLLREGRPVRAMARDPAAVQADVEVVRGDVVSGEGLDAALDGTASAYYLVHSME